MNPQYERSINEEAKGQIYEQIINALGKAVASGMLPAEPIPAFKVEVPSRNQHGDFATNVAMVSGSVFKKAPREIADIIMKYLCLAGTYFTKAEVNGPGFINFFLSPTYYQDVVYSVLTEEDNYGWCNYGGDDKVCVMQIVSPQGNNINATMVRGAVIADSLSAIQSAVGYMAYTTLFLSSPLENAQATISEQLSQYNVKFDNTVKTNIAGADNANELTNYLKEQIKNSAFEKIIFVVNEGQVALIERVKNMLKEDVSSLSIFNTLTVGDFDIAFNKGTIQDKLHKSKDIGFTQFSEEAPCDGSRFFLNMEKANSHMTFEVGLCAEQSMQNPCYYVRYTYSRMCSLIKNVVACGTKIKDFTKVDFSGINTNEEKQLISHIATYEEELIVASKEWDTTRVTSFMVKCAELAQSFVTKCPLKCEDENLRQIRIAICNMVKIVLGNCLNLFKISAPEIL